MTPGLSREEIARRLYAAASAPLDIEDAKKLTDPEIEIVSVFSAVEGATFRGHDGLEKWAAGLHEIWADLRFELIELIEGDDVSVALYRVRGEARESEVPLDERPAMMWHWKEDRIVRSETFLDPADALRAAGLDQR
jgi:ketosteroid isomerase-like protein